ncbi:hypothetical protein [Desulfitibacter alkalitolerans]|uniref:hypothetical protein n=1 Tax=Desulfitibacter alkalitolerans TaxID=264641 RepID=UPI0004861629|nr:hypothetical protein [Desulfitibacter alkalitolerans]
MIIVLLLEDEPYTRRFFKIELGADGKYEELKDNFKGPLKISSKKWLNRHYPLKNIKYSNIIHLTQIE